MVWPVDRFEPQPKNQCFYVTKKSILGDGHFSVVKECMNTVTKERYAMKLIRKSVVRGKLHLIQREVDVLKRINTLINNKKQTKKRTKFLFEGHNHVLKLIDYFETPKNIALITELCASKDLYDMIIESGKLDYETQVRPFTACLISALQFLHENGIVHRDIKAENILFRLQKKKGNPLVTAKGLPKYDSMVHDMLIADFGLSINSEKGSQEYVGTISYLAPEVVACRYSACMSSLQRGRLMSYGEKVDIWALGVLCYFMTFGYMPFDCDSDKETLECIKKGDFYMEPGFITDPKYQHFWLFLDSCFTMDSEHRPAASQLKKHAFVEDYFPSNTVRNVKSFQEKELPFFRASKSTTALHSLVTPKRSLSSFSISFDVMAGSAGLMNSKNIKETLKAALPITSMRETDEKQSNTVQKSHPIFLLEEKSYGTSYMNGHYCVTPESRSNFTTSPVISRAPSQSNLSITCDSQDETRCSSLSSSIQLSKLADERPRDFVRCVKEAPKRYLSELTSTRITFDLGIDYESEAEIT